MADLTLILGGEYFLPKITEPDPPEMQLHQSIEGAGMTAPDQIYLDGKIHRFNSGSKGKPGAGDKTGWYVGFADGIACGVFGDWRTGESINWTADTGRKLSAEEHMRLLARRREAQAIRDADIKKRQETAADTVDIIWKNGAEASPDHPYLKKKGVNPHGAKITGDGRLMVPLYDVSGDLSSLQYIDSDGGKLYHPGAATGGKYWHIGDIDGAKKIYLAEGFATAATIHEFTDCPVVIAYSASNLVPVTGLIKDKYPSAQIVIIADNDKSGVGQKYADQASAKYGCRVIIPPIPGDANDYAQSGHDLDALLNPPSDDWLIPADDWRSQPAPISWIVKNWIQSNALIMVHGPSGGGKTFVVLDWCLSIAAGHPEWNGLRIHHGHIVYLAGEGHHGLRSRLAAWCHHKSASSLKMWLSRDGCDLNKPDGYLRVIDNIRDKDINPKLIVVDTLHRFMAGDENSAQDAKTMLDACAGLMREFNCSVMLVHHTGVSEEAQHRARGSSAWRGALDIEISVIPSKPNRPIEIVQRKSKDAELAESLFFSLQSVEIPGWLDEDGEPVTSAILMPEDAPEVHKVDKKLASARHTFKEAWYHSGKERIDGAPYVSKSGLKNYFESAMDYSKATINQYMKEADDRFLGTLLKNSIISQISHGYMMIDDFSDMNIYDGT
jgi:phage/plasmid primase-like uncharacterized protein